ncbi:immunoglobulin superfamily member 5 isoform X5 [Etheostoma cragini]|uniref:immunoglobulin superfamily member 5 isoform X5 n=1 Tax=Etheostoma cragini TaxID=417921 RepID=UPI00155E62B6|nr:immunoglobulin superfamily member 5 isoform X5 [Etheostoma cragini]
MDVFSLLVLLLSSRIQAVGAQMKLSPGTLTVLRGEEARLTCSTSNTQWTVMVWLMNGTSVLTISKEIGVLPSINPNVMAEKSSDSQGDSWVFVLKNTQRHNQGQVTCDLQGIDRKTASLFVQEKGSVRVIGEDKLAFKGQLVPFECQAAGWYPQPTLQWQVNNKKVSQGEYNISSEELGKSLFNVTSNLNFTAAQSSNVDCLASVSALPTPLKSSVRLTVEKSGRVEQKGAARSKLHEFASQSQNANTSLLSCSIYSGNIFLKSTSLGKHPLAYYCKLKQKIEHTFLYPLSANL